MKASKVLTFPTVLSRIVVSVIAHKKKEARNDLVYY